MRIVYFTSLELTKTFMMINSDFFFSIKITALNVHFVVTTIMGKSLDDRECKVREQLLDCWVQADLYISPGASAASLGFYIIHGRAYVISLILVFALPPSMKLKIYPTMSKGH